MKFFKNRIKKLEVKIYDKFGKEEGFQKWLKEHPLSEYGSYIALHNIVPDEYKGRIMKLILKELRKQDE